MKDKSYFLVTGLVFLTVSLLHFIRIISGWELKVADFVVPMWLSWAAVVVLGYLAYNGLKKN